MILKCESLSKKIASSVQRIAKGGKEILELGDISVEKEWTFAGDVAEGMMTLVEQEQVSEAIIGSGVGYTIENWLEQCFGLIGKQWQDHVKLQEGFKPEYTRLISNPDRINSIGWFPKVGFPELAKNMVIG